MEENPYEPPRMEQKSLDWGQFRPFLMVPMFAACGAVPGFVAIQWTIGQPTWIAKPGDLLDPVFMMAIGSSVGGFIGLIGAIRDFVRFR